MKVTWQSHKFLGMRMASRRSGAYLRLLKKVQAYSIKHPNREDAEKRFANTPDRSDSLPEILDEVYGARQAQQKEVRAQVLGTNTSSKDFSVGWYIGPKDEGGTWAQYRDRLAANPGMKKALETIDEESTAVVSQLANPYEANDKKKGLVLGYVQSGKTANYAAVISKAADAGYKMVIVLAGMYTALRQQTQQRLARDLATSSSFIPHSTEAPRHWELLTGSGPKDSISTDSDMNAEVSKRGRNVNANDESKIYLAVVKKNSAILRNLIKFLENIKEIDIKRFPVLIIDDESDQATPNTLAEKNKLSTINKRVRDLWDTVRIGTYVAYTATPFANLLMDPNDEFELYPSDFFVAMNKPEGYFGAREYFGLRETGITKNENFDPVLDAVRIIPAAEVQEIEPKKKGGVQPPASMVPSLERVIEWFLIATSIRKYRGYQSHSTMLVHTSMKTDSHQDVAYLIKQYLVDLQGMESEELATKLRATFDAEYYEASENNAYARPEWSQLVPFVLDALDQVRIIIDNSESEERLEYDMDSPATTIVVGGNTLSRGLTLEGLVCSYFARVSKTADTLLQMGRWFGYRPGYEDLVRIWLSEDVRETFTFIADIEAELRDEAQLYIDQQQTPSEIGVRMRTYPGIVDLTARNKMFFAHTAGMKLQGTRLQTHIFENSARTIDHNWTVLKNTVRNFRNASSAIEQVRQHVVMRDVPSSLVQDFLKQFWIHPDLTSLQDDGLGAWIRQYAQDEKWNVVLVSPQSGQQVSVADEITISLSKRAPTVTSTDLKTNIRALIAPEDLKIDLPEVDPKWSIPESIEARREQVNRNGLLLLYLIDKDSTPTAKTSGTRKALHAPNHVPLFGLVPPFLPPGTAQDGDYVSVKLERSANSEYSNG